MNLHMNAFAEYARAAYAFDPKTTRMDVLTRTVELTAAAQGLGFESTERDLLMFAHYMLTDRSSLALARYRRSQNPQTYGDLVMAAMEIQFLGAENVPPCHAFLQTANRVFNGEDL